MDILMTGQTAHKLEDWTAGLTAPNAPLELVPQNVVIRNVDMERGEVKVVLVHDIHVTDENKMVALKASCILALVATSSCILVVLILGLSQ